MNVIKLFLEYSKTSDRYKKLSLCMPQTHRDLLSPRLLVSNLFAAAQHWFVFLTTRLDFTYPNMPAKTLDRNIQHSPAKKARPLCWLVNALHNFLLQTLTNFEARSTRSGIGFLRFTAVN